MLQLTTWRVVIGREVMVGLYGDTLPPITTHHIMGCDICYAKICDTRLILKTGTCFLSFISFLLYLYPFFSLHIYLYYFYLLLCFSFYYTLSLYSLHIYLYYFYLLLCFSFYYTLSLYSLHIISIIFIYYHVSPFLCLVVGK